MRIHVFDSTEGYPVYKVTSEIEGYEEESFEVDEETLDRWQKVSDDFEKMQLEIAEMVREREGRDYELECWVPMEVFEDE